MEWAFFTGLGATRLRPFDQRRWKFQSLSQDRLLLRHLAMITLVIEACEVKDAMQHQNFNFIRQRMAKVLGVLPGNVGGNRKLTDGALRLMIAAQRPRKRQYIGSFVGSPKSPVE